MNIKPKIIIQDKWIRVTEFPKNVFPRHILELSEIDVMGKISWVRRTDSTGMAIAEHLAKSKAARQALN